MKKSFVILSEPRSASGYIFSLLQQTNEFYMKMDGCCNQEEVLNECLHLNKDDLTNLFINYYNKSNYVGSKVLLRNGQFFDSLLNIIDYLELKVILLERSDYINQILSYLYAKEISCFHNQYISKNKHKIGLDVKIKMDDVIETTNYYNDCYINKIKVKEHYNNSNIDKYLNINYNEIITPKGLSMVFDFLSIEEIELSNIQIEKKMNVNYKDKIINYQEVLECIKNNRKLW